MRARKSVRRLAGTSTGLVALLALVPAPAPAQQADQPLFVDVRQGTDLSLATAPGLDFIIIELLGRLWRLPVSGGAATALTPADIEVRLPRLNDAGTEVVYQRLGAQGWDIWTANLAGNRHTAVTSAPGNEREPDFLPDSGGFVFTADRAGQYDLWSVERAGAPWQPVSTEPGNARFPDVADNGALAYIVEDAGTYSLRTRAGGLTRTLYETSSRLGAPGWRPGGGVIVFQERGSDAIARLQMAILAPELLIRELSAGEDLFASRIGWLDSASFLYAADGQIWRRTLAGNARRPVHLFATAMIARPQIRPAALDTPGAPQETIADAASRTDSAMVFAAAGDLWLYRDGTTQQLTDDEWWNEDPLLDPQGRFVVFARNHAGERRLWRLPLDAERPPEALTRPGVRAFAAALDSTGARLAYLTSESGFSESAPATVHTLELENGRQRRSAESSVRALSRPHWLTDNRLATLSIETLQSNGASAALTYDAALRVTTVATLQDLPPAALPQANDFAAFAATRAPPRAQRPWVIQAGRLFDGLGTTYERHVDIHIEAGRIKAVVARGRLPLPETVIDATDLTVMPGFIDLHSHDSSLLGELAGRAWLAWGVTTVRSVGPHTASQRALAAAWNAGLLAGPRFIEAQRSAITDAGSDLTLQPPALLDDPFITLPGEAPTIDLTDTLLPPLRPTQPGMPARRFSPGIAHYQDVFALLAASGATEISSLGAFAPAATEQLLAGNAAAADVFERLFRAADRSVWRTAPALVDGIAARQQSLSRLLRAGGRVAIGTESPHTPPGLGVHIELRLFAGGGVPNDQVLRSATSTAALALGLSTEIGAVEAGRRADLVIIAGDPLRDISDTQAIRAVVRGGEWVERSAVITPPPTERGFLRALAVQ